MTSSKRSSPATPPPPSLWRQDLSRSQQRQAKRDAVLRAAAQLFNEKGFHATSLDDVAERLGVTKPTLYYYVKNKDQILIECMAEALNRMLEKIAQSRRAGRSTLEQLRDYMYAYGTLATQPFGACLIRVGDQVLPPEGRQELRRMKSEINLQFRQLVEQGVQEGVLAPCDPTVTAFLIQGAMGWLAHWYQPKGSLSADDIVTECIDRLLQGVMARSANAV